MGLGPGMLLFRLEFGWFEGLEKESVIVLRMCSVMDPIRMLRARRRAGLRISLRSFGSAAVGAIFAIGFWDLWCVVI